MSDNPSAMVTAAWSVAVLVVFLFLWQFGPGWLGVPEFVLVDINGNMLRVGCPRLEM